MKWIKASERLPVDGQPDSIESKTFREIDSKRPITDIWKFHADCIELNNYPSISGNEIPFTNVEWLDETPIPDTDGKEQDEWISVEDRLPEDGQIVDIWEMPMTQHLERALSLKGTSYANEYYHDTDYNGWRSTNYKFTIEKDQDGVMNCFTKLEEKYLNPLSSYSYKKLIVENGEVTHWMPLPSSPVNKSK